MNAFLFIIAALATFRLSLMVSKEDGPMWIFRKLRREIPKHSSAKAGIQCQWCVSIWMAIPVSLFVFYRETIPVAAAQFGDWFLLMLALSTVAIAINQTFTRDNR